MWKDDGADAGTGSSVGRMEGGEPGSRLAVGGERLPLAGQGMDGHACGDSGDGEVAGIRQRGTGEEVGAS